MSAQHDANTVIRVVIIGSGNVAEGLASALADHRDTCRMEQVFARNAVRGAHVARMASCGWTDRVDALAEADLYLMAVSDRSVGELSNKLTFGDAVVAHTAGSVPLSELSTAIHHRGVFYPLQTFTAGRRVTLSDVPIFIEGEDDPTRDMLHRLGSALSRTVVEASSEDRGKLHLAAVFACNFATHMIALGEQTLSAYRMPSEWIHPLVRETIDKILETSDASTQQTGPAVRGDLPTQERHLKLLENQPQLHQLYRDISKSIWETSKKI